MMLIDKNNKDNENVKDTAGSLKGKMLSDDMLDQVSGGLEPMNIPGVTKTYEAANWAAISLS